MKGKLSIALLLSIVALGNVCVAEDAQKEERVITGIAASKEMVGGGKGNISIGAQAEAPGDPTSVISASVSTGKGGSCVATLKNMSQKNAYSVTYNVIGTDASGAQQLKRSYADTIKAGGTVEKSISGCDKNLNLQVVIKSGRKVQ